MRRGFDQYRPFRCRGCTLLLPGGTATCTDCGMPQLGPVPPRAPRGPERPGVFQETMMVLGFAKLVALPLALGWTLVLAVCDWLELSQVWYAAGHACVVAACAAAWASLWPRRYLAWSPERGWFDPREARE